MKLIDRLVMWFLYSAFGQWVSRLFSGGWCFVTKNDPRFMAFASFPYEGDSSVDPSRGVATTKRGQWRTWAALLIHEGCGGVFFAIDIYDGRRMAYLKHPVFQNEWVCFRVGHESGEARLLVPQTKTNYRPPRFVLPMLRWHADEAMPIELKETKRHFI